MSRTWILNLDAEVELAGGTSVDPYAALARRPHLAEALSPLLGEDLVLRRDDEPVVGSPRGRAWCPTPGALRELARRGVVPPSAPPLDVLRRVNHRAFSSALGPTLEEGRFVTSLDEALSVLARPSPTGTWLLKRPLGFAGRGRALAPPLTDAVKRFVSGCIESEGGLQIEPLHERSLDASIHGFVSSRGIVTLGEPTVQDVGAQGAWRSTRRVGPGELFEDETRAMKAEAERVAAALLAEGYFGPFGVDAFRYRARGRDQFQPRCEVNARFTMGFAVGMGERRPDREDDDR